MKRTNIHLTDNEIERLKETAKLSGLSVAEIVRRAVDEFLCLNDESFHLGAPLTSPCEAKNE